MLKSIQLSGFKSFAKKGELVFSAPISAIVGPNGSGKSNIAEAFRFVLGEQSIKSLRGKKGEDLIFGGTDQVPRTGRASVRVVFNNERKIFDIDFDEFVIERIVHRDGVNQYLINGSQVRLRDVIELLAKANIGSSGHHIISQGEADRILSASPVERKGMVEDALGLRIFHYKLAESDRKLKRTRENINHVQSLRKEIAPHLAFLKRQVEKVEKTLSLRDKLTELYREYLKRESVYLEHIHTNLAQRRSELEKKLTILEEGLREAKKVLLEHDKTAKKKSEILTLEQSLRSTREKKDERTRALGRLEGAISAEERLIERNRERAQVEHRITLTFQELNELYEKVTEYSRGGLEETDVSVLQRMLTSIRDLVRNFVAEKKNVSTPSEDIENREKVLQKLKEEQHIATKEYEMLDGEEQTLQEEYTTLQREINEAQDESRDAERRVFEIMSEQQTTRAALDRVVVEEQQRKRDDRAFEQEIEEGSVLVGTTILSYKQHAADVEEIVQESRDKQEERRRVIERIKIRLEEAGSGSGEELIKEYEEVRDRDDFLEREIADLEKSEESLRNVITDLESTLGTRFHGGIDSINKEFQNFFALMFGGGKASISVSKEQKRRRQAVEEGVESEEEKEPEEGVEIHVNLPRKRIKSLEMLSGGERALTSIALLFAMSQVNPPPFLILDETDAALDEANSRRYGDMIENLAKRSQLILITHNRETMSRAGILYGVTMGSDGVSKLLSVQFDDAVVVAK
jgi:chromosome segregation protein